MKVAVIKRKFLTGVRRISEFCRYCWNRLVMRFTIDSAPTFIVGCGHSGTSVLLAILGAHPRIFSVPYESRIAEGESERRFQKALKKFDRSAIAAGKHRWVEKTPKHILHIEKILKWHPSAKIILMRRDGRDVAHSLKRRDKGNLKSGVKRWCEDNLASKEYWNHPSVHLVKYEDLIVDFEGTMVRILSFLDEEYFAEIKNYHEIERKWYATVIAKPAVVTSGESHTQYRNWQINQPLFDGRGRWKELSTEEISYVDEVAGSLLAEFGYTELDPSTGDKGGEQSAD